MYILTNIGNSNLNENKKRKVVVISEAQRRLLSESQESKSQSEAVKLLVREKGWGKETANDFARGELRSLIPALRDTKIAKFTLGVARMYCHGELNDDKRNATLTRVLRLIASEGKLDDYNRNLMKVGSKSNKPMSAKELIDEYKDELKRRDDEEAEKMANADYTDTKSDYEIVLIHSFEEAHEYSSYVSWCITKEKKYWKKYLGDGTYYFCLKEGFKNIKPEAGDGCPFDEYGLSMLAVSVNPDGSLHHCTTRWNHDHGGNDDMMTEAKISETVKVNFRDTFVHVEDGIDRDYEMTEEEYIEAVYEDSVSVLDNGNNTLFELSQDRNPENGVYRFNDGPDAIYYVYNNDNDEVISYDDYRKNNAVVKRWGVASLLKTTNNVYTFLYIGKNGEGNFITDIGKYWLDDEFDMLLLECSDGKTVSFVIWTTFTKKAVEVNCGAKSVDSVYTSAETDNDMFIQIRDENGYVFLFNQNGKVYLQHEVPADGAEWFVLEDDLCFHCASGKVVDIDGNIISSATAGYEVVGSLTKELSVVQNSDGKKNVLNRNTNNLICDIFVDGITNSLSKDWLVMKMGNLYNLFNVHTHKFLGKNWSNDYSVMPDGSLFAMAFNNSEGKRDIVIFGAGGEQLTSTEDKIRKMGFIADGEILIAYSETKGLILIDRKTNERISDKLPFRITAKDTDFTPDKLYALRKDNGQWIIFDAKNNSFGKNEYDDCVFDYTNLGIAHKDGKTGLIHPTTGELLYNTFFDHVGVASCNCYLLQLNGKQNLIYKNDPNHQFVSNRWFDSVGGYYAPFKIMVTLDGVRGVVDISEHNFYRFVKGSAAVDLDHPIGLDK